MLAEDKENADGPLAAAIRERIARSGLTAYRVGKLSGASIDAIGRFLGRKRGLSLGSADKIAATLGISVSLDPNWTWSGNDEHDPNDPGPDRSPNW